MENGGSKAGRHVQPARRRTPRRYPLFAILYLLFAAGCGHYSFTGASIPEHLRTIAIPIVEDRSASPVSTLEDLLTDGLVQRFVQQTRLRLQPDENAADAVLDVTIDRYTNRPTAVTGAEVAALNRVTIRATAVYRDRVEGRELLSRSFEGFDEYDPAAQGLDGEIAAATRALEIIADDIFTAATSDW